MILTNVWVFILLQVQSYGLVYIKNNTAGSVCMGIGVMHKHSVTFIQMQKSDRVFYEWIVAAMSIFQPTDESSCYFKG